MSKVISFSKQKQIDGINKVVDLMKITIGPRGKNVSLTNGDTVNDGGRIAEDITFKDSQENKGATKVRNLVRKITRDVGGGRTATAILYQELIKVGMDLLNRGFNFNQLKKGMQLAVKDIHEQLDKMSKPAKGHLEQIATISTESEELGKVIADTIKKVGLDSVVTVEESQSFGVTSEIADGLKFDKGYMSPYMITDPESLQAVYKDINVLILDNKLNDFGEIKPLLDKMLKDGKKELFIIAEDIDESVLRFFAFGKFNGLFKAIAIKTPGIGDMKKFCLEDLSALTGASVVKDLKTDKIQLGYVKKVISTKDSTTIFSAADIKTWITTLKTRSGLSDNAWEKDQFNERIAKLQNGIAVIKVGASSEDEVKYLKLKIEDGVNETKRALESGIVIGGNISYIYAQKEIKPKTLPNEQVSGYNIVMTAIEAPLKQIVSNGTGQSDVVINIIRNSKNLRTMGYNSLDNTICEDMYKEGIIDATKVVKTVLEYAVNEAILLLSIGGDISEEVIETK